MFSGGIFPTKRVYRLSEVHEDDPDFFGEKAATLGRLVRLKLPVPDGFVIVSEGRDININRISLSDNLKKQIKNHLCMLEEATGRHFFTSEESEPGAVSQPCEAPESDENAAKFPLLLSCRQSPKGNNTPLFPTSLNLGFNDAVAARALKLSNRPFFVLDCYRRFIQDYGIHILGIQMEKYCNIVDNLCKQWGIESASQASVPQLRELVAEYKNITPIPQDPFRQVCAAIEAILRHHESLESSVYRSSHGESSDRGVCVIVQSQIYSNLTALSSGYGSAYSRNTATGESITDAGLSGLYYSRAEGGDEIVPGTRKITLFKELSMLQPFIYQELVKTVEIVEKDYRDMVRVDFLVENGQLYIIHATQAVSKTPEAAMRTLVDFTKDSASQGILLNQREAVCRLDIFRLPAGDHEVWTTDDNARKLLRWAQNSRYGTTLGVLCEIRSSQDMQRGAQLHADSFGVIYLDEILSTYFQEDLIDASSPAKSVGERALTLHSLRLKFTKMLVSLINATSQVIANDGVIPMDIDEVPSSTSIGGELLQSKTGRYLMRGTGDQHQHQASLPDNESLYKATGGRCNCLPSVTVVLGEEKVEGREATPIFLHPDYIQAQAHAAADALLKAQPTMCTCCEICTDLQPGSTYGETKTSQMHSACSACTVELNIAVPFCISPDDLKQSLTYVEAGVIAAFEEWDLATIGSIIDDTNVNKETPNAIRAKDRVLYNIGVALSTPQACYNARAICSIPLVNFIVFDLDSITSLALGHRFDPDGATESSPAYKVRREGAIQCLLSKGFLPNDPYSSLERSCVFPMVMKSAESGRKSASVLGKQVKVLARGASAVHDAKSIAKLAEFMDAIIVEPRNLPKPLFVAAGLSGRGKSRFGYDAIKPRSAIVPDRSPSTSSKPVDEGMMQPVIKTLGGMFESAKSGMKDLFQQEEEPFYMIA